MNHMPAKSVAHQNPSRKMVSWWAYLGLTVVWLGTAGLSILASDSSAAARFNLSVMQLRLLQLVFVLPGLVILLAILFAALSIWRYARAIAGAKEAAGFRSVAYGISALLIGLVVGNYVSSMRQLVVQHAADPEKVKTAFVIVNNYVSVAWALVTYGFLLRGSQLLLRSIGKRLNLKRKLLPTVAVFAVLTVTYLWLIHGNPGRQMSASPDLNPTFGLPYWLTVLTVALPFVVAWFVGVLALIGMYQYRTQTPGVVYKLLFKKLIIGMTLFTGLTIILQLLTQLYSVYATHSLPAILGIVALIYITLTYAFILVAQGARKLNSIENLLIE